MSITVETDITVETWNKIAKQHDDLLAAICKDTDEARESLTRMFGRAVTDCNGDAVLALQHFAKRCMRAGRHQTRSYLDVTV